MQWLLGESYTFSKDLVLFEPVINQVPKHEPWTIWQGITHLMSGLHMLFQSCDETLRDYWPWVLLLLQGIGILVLLRIIIYIIKTIQELIQIVAHILLALQLIIVTFAHTLVPRSKRKQSSGIYKNC